LVKEKKVKLAREMQGWKQCGGENHQADILASFRINTGFILKNLKGRITN